MSRVPKRIVCPECQYKIADRHLKRHMETIHKKIDWQARARAAEAERDRLRAALLAIQSEPHGCPFCDSGKLRNPDKGHLPECGFGMIDAALRGGKEQTE